MRAVYTLRELIMVYDDDHTPNNDVKIMFGKHKGQTLDKIPTKYISWAKNELSKAGSYTTVSDTSYTASKTTVELPKITGRFVHNVYLKALSEQAGFDVSIPYKNLTEDQKQLREAIARQTEQILRGFVDKLMAVVTSPGDIRSSAESLLKEMFGE